MVELGVRDVAVLPDWVFGERRLLGLEVNVPVSGIGVALSGVGMPDPMIIWQVQAWQSYGASGGSYLRFALVRGAPASEAAVMGQDAVLPGFGLEGAEPRAIYVDRYMNDWFADCRMVRSTGGLELCLMGVNGGTSPWRFRLSVVYSAVPAAVPEWVARVLGLMG